MSVGVKGFKCLEFVEGGILKVETVKSFNDVF